jgi:hypothetical protein
MVPLRHTLETMVNSRIIAMRNGRSHHKDQAAMDAAIGRIQQFLRSNPFATDARVRWFCDRWPDDVVRVCPANQRHVLARLTEKEPA